MIAAFRPRLQRAGEAFATLWTVIRLTWAASPKLVFLTLVVVAVQSFASPLELGLARAVVDRASLDLGLGGNQDSLAAHLPLVAWIAIAALVVGITQLLEPFERIFGSIIGDRFTGDMAERLVRTANSWLGLARFEDPSFADDLERVRRYSRRSGLELMSFGVVALTSLFTNVLLALVLLRLHPLIPLVLLMLSLPQMAQWWNYNYRTASHLYVKTPEARRLRYSRSVLLQPEPAKDVRLYNLGPFFEHYYNENFKASMGTLREVRDKAAILVSLSALLGGLGTGAVVLYAIWLASRGEITAGDVVLYGGATVMLQSGFVELGTNLGFLPMYFGTYLTSLMRVLNAPPDLPTPDAPRHLPERLAEGVTFEDVWFTYPGTEQPVLCGVSFGIQPGEGLALVGNNGAGKTTIVKLLLRMYDPDQGRILIDGTDLRDLDVDELRSRMGVIFQDFVRYEMTARENIAMANLSTISDDSKLREAATRARAEDLLSALDGGLDAQLGRQFGGRELSGGEWQKLALARAFVRPCDILVLDEPTAALDVQTEYEVYNSFYDLTRDRATLLISHRFSTVRMADRILFLQDGRILEEGSHEQLMAHHGRYAHLYGLQAARYLGNGEEGKEE